MKHKIRFLFLIFLISIQCLGQNIYSALRHDSGLDLRDEPRVIKIVQKTIFINDESTTTKKDLILVNSKHKTLTEERYNENGKLKKKLTFEFDSTGLNSLWRKVERWHQIMGYSSETAYYFYDTNGFFIRIQDKNQNGIIFRETQITNNKNGDPIELIVKEGDGVQFGKEIAEYDYPNNTVITRVIDNDGNVISESSGTKDLSIKSETNKYNQYGDLVKSSNYEYEYKYDKYSNWVKRIIYKIEGDKKNNYQIITRKIKYLKE
ncbi:MAG: hypothetical protein OEW75_08225 [Cyclobacteriaceae bacterium]|nr:hypothetical protein [Cyclobacteriaceae bacterium]